MVCQPSFQDALFSIVVPCAKKLGISPPSIQCHEVSVSLETKSWQFSFVCFSALLFFICTYIFVDFVAKPLARWLLHSGSTKHEKAKQEKIDKFAQSLNEIFQYGTFFVVGGIILAGQTWLWPSINWWIGQALGDHDRTALEVSAFYLLYLARYISNLLFVLALEHRRKDFVEMVIHHSVTSALVAMSYNYSYWRVGLIIMVLLDLAEPPLHIAKLAKYMQESRSSTYIYDLVSNMMFNVFGVTFFVTRLIMFGYITWSCWVEAYATSIKEGNPRKSYTDELYLCDVMCTILLLLQCFWFGLIIKVAINQSKTGKLEDVRSDDEDDEDDRNLKIKKN